MRGPRRRRRWPLPGQVSLVISYIVFEAIERRPINLRGMIVRRSSTGFVHYRLLGQRRRDVVNVCRYGVLCRARSEKQ